MPTEAITDLYAASEVRSGVTMATVGEVWGRIDPARDWAEEWARLVPRASAVVAASQLGAARDGAASVAAVLEQSGFPERQLAVANPAGFMGWMQADSGEMVPLTQALATAPIVRAREAAGSVEDRLLAGRSVLEALAQTAAADAARHAATAQGAATEWTKCMFYEPPPMCQRCAVIVGREYPFGTQFSRHPRCDGQVMCISQRDYQRDIYSLTPDDITDLNRWQRQAIEDGADVNQVVNAQTRPIGGRTARSPLYAGGTRTHSTYSRRVKSRLTPKGVYAEADGNRARAVELLEANGYVLGRYPTIPAR